VPTGEQTAVGVVSKQEIISLVWPDTFVDGSNLKVKTGACLVSRSRLTLCATRMLTRNLCDHLFYGFGLTPHSSPAERRTWGPFCRAAQRTPCADHHRPPNNKH
jgi:hypothetical protein